jgi:hypothetical protein
MRYLIHQYRVHERASEGTSPRRRRHHAVLPLARGKVSYMNRINQVDNPDAPAANSVVPSAVAFVTDSSSRVLLI